MGKALVSVALDEALYDKFKEYFGKGAITKEINNAMIIKIRRHEKKIEAEASEQEAATGKKKKAR